MGASTEQIKPETLIWKHGSKEGWLSLNKNDLIRKLCGFPEPKLPEESNVHKAKAPDQEVEWYYQDQYREKQGPVNKPELLMMLEQEKIAPQTLVWKAGMEDWETAQDVLFTIQKDMIVKILE